MTLLAYFPPRAYTRIPSLRRRARRIRDARHPLQELRDLLVDIKIKSKFVPSVVRRMWSLLPPTVFEIPAHTCMQASYRCLQAPVVHELTNITSNPPARTWWPWTSPKKRIVRRLFHRDSVSDSD
jgi:hypothetical protein